MNNPFTIYDKHPHADAYRVGSGYTGYAIIGVEKRFTDAEIAAELWRMEAVISDLNAQSKYGGVKVRDVLMAHADAETIKRFATLPHYDE